MARHRTPTSRPRGRIPRACRSRHPYGAGQKIGAGIVRYVCNACGAVSIDLSRVDEVVAIGSLFESSEGRLLRT